LFSYLQAANAKAVAEEQTRQLQDRLKQSSDRLDEAHETVQRLHMEASESVKAHEKEIELLHAQANDAAEKAKSLHEQLDTAHGEVQRLQSQIQDAKQALVSTASPFVVLRTACPNE
jgi:chromosome segregation ATPase